MSFRMVLKSLTLNDLEQRNGPYFALIHRIFSERELTFTFAICCRPSVCRLASVVCRLSVV